MTRIGLAFVLVFAAVCATPVLAFAGATPDPHVIITDPPGTCTSVGLHFDFNADGMGGGVFCFTNNSGIDWFDLDVVVQNPFDLNQLTCGGNAFLFCAIEMENGFTTVDFFGGSLPNGMSFQVDLLGFTPNGAFHADANQPMPEPTTLLLLASGLGPFVVQARRKRGNS
jgi:hypothetical protein